MIDIPSTQKYRICIETRRDGTDEVTVEKFYPPSPLLAKFGRKGEWLYCSTGMYCTNLGEAKEWINREIGREVVKVDYVEFP